MWTIDEQLNFFSVKVNNGSGCIFQPHTNEYTYVLTVKHNLKEIDNRFDAKVFRFNSEASDEIIVKAIYTHPNPDIDLALLIVDYIGDSDFHLMYSKYERGEIVRAFGYPEISKNLVVKTNSFLCKCDTEYEKNISYRIISQNPLFTFNRSSAQNVVGFSGCGLFYEEEGNIILKGIFPELNHSDGAYNALIAYQIECFEDIISENNLKNLTPEFLLNFRHYKKLAFYSIEPHISTIIKESLEKIINSKISPSQIADLFKGELYVPYTENYRNKLVNKNLWKGWLELLTVLSIIAEDNSDENEHLLLKSYLNKIKLLFSSNEPTLSMIIQKLIVDEQLKRFLIDDFCIVINSVVEPAKRIYTKSSVKNIIPNIGIANRFSRDVMIDEGSINYSFSCLHLSHFLSEIGNIDQNENSKNEINIGNIRDIIQNVMQNLND